MPGRATCVVLNAKIVVDLELEEVLIAHRGRGALATLVVRPDPNAERWGAIGVDSEGRVTSILDQTQGSSAGVVTPCQFTGIHVVEPELIEAIPEEGPSCVIRGAYTDLLRRGAPLFGFVHRGYFYDHSTPARYLQGNLNLLSGAAEPSHSPGPLSGVDPSAAIEPGARLVPPVLVGPGVVVEAGAIVGPRVVVGREARVTRDVRLEEAVVWPGASVERSGVHLVATPRGVVPVPRLADPAESPR
jgi:NDP-sugar pyrophosphorylase family protein